MRALFYYHALDLYRNIPFVTENDPIGTYVPPCYTPQQTFEYIESELKGCVENMASKDDCPYGEASKGAAYTLLAKLYLNAETYTGTAKYSECIDAANRRLLRATRSTAIMHSSSMPTTTNAPTNNLRSAARPRPLDDLRIDNVSHLRLGKQHIQLAERCRSGRCFALGQLPFTRKPYCQVCRWRQRPSLYVLHRQAESVHL